MAPAHPILLAWFTYGGSAVLYSAFVLHGEFPLNGARILSKKNIRPITSMITMHAVILGILLYSVHMAVAVFPFLPNWLTIQVTGRGHVTLFELILILVFVCISQVERKWLYVEQEDSASGSTESPGFS